MRRVLLASIAVNVGLATVLLWPERKQEATSPESVAVEVQSPAPLLAPRKIVTVEVPATGFHWNQVESSDFRQYMGNLRAIGCPEETIRDLVLAEVNKLYAPKFAALAAQAQHYDYWKPSSKKAREGMGRELEALRAEKRDLLKTLLGIESEPSERWANITVDELVDEGRFAFLSADKQKQLREILARYDLNGDVDPRQVREKRREELAKVLSPEELYQFELRDSNAADSVRSRFGQADLTEAEYKKLFDLRKAYEDEVGAIADNSDPEKARKRSEARKLLAEAYKNALGEDRHSEISRQQDPGWRSLTQVAQNHNLDPQIVNRAYEFQQAAGEQMRNLFSDPNLPREDRRKAVDLINAELQRNMASVLGDSAYQEFRKAGPQVTFTTGGDSFVIPTVPSGDFPSGSSLIISTRQAK